MAAHTEHVRYGSLDQDYVAALEAVPEEDDGPLLMLNLMRYRTWADYPDGFDDGPRISGREADDRYAPLAVLHEIGAQVVFFAEVAAQVRGDEGWDRIAIVRYPSARSFLDMQERPDFVALHVHKDAGMERTIIAVCHPVTGSVGPGTRLRVDLLGGPPHTAPAAPAPGRLVLRVDGTPVGDGRAWTTATIGPVTDDPAAEPTGVPATSVLVDALIQELP